MDNFTLIAELEAIYHLNVLLVLGIAVFGGTVGARVFQKLRIPQVVGYIVVGVLIGEPLLKFVDAHTVKMLSPFSMFALGIIGFMIGGELRYEVFKKYGKQFFAIMLSEGLFAFAIVTVLTTLIGYLFTGSWQNSIALGLVLGAISSATAPAATVDVLWEYKTRGILTRTVLAIVALDDGLALLLYALASSIAGALMGQGNGSLLKNIAIPFWEIIGAVVLGVLAALLLIFLLKYVKGQDKILTFTVALVILTVGLSMALGVESILAAMVLGATISNFLPRRSQSSFELLGKFSPPIYVLFFVLVGAQLELGNMPFWVVALALVYVFGRTVGKISGSWFGAKVSNSPHSVRKYLGLCLFSQAGVAIGLSILASHRFEGNIGDAVILIITATTFLVQIIGPPCVKLAVKKAGEVGMNVTEEDLIKTYEVRDVMNAEPTSIAQDLPLQQILEAFSTSDSVYYPVIDDQSRLVGIITIADIKEMFANRDVAGWLLACDVAEPVLDKTTLKTPLEEAMERMRRYNLENMPVVVSEDSDKLVGVLDHSKALRKISAEVLHRRRVADEMAWAAG